MRLKVNIAGTGLIEAGKCGENPTGADMGNLGWY